MNFRSTLFIVFVISAAGLSCMNGVDASRLLCEDFASVNHLQTHSSVYQKAKYSKQSGPSDKGGGN